MDSVYGFCADPNVNYTFYNNEPEKLLSDLALFLLGDKNGTDNWNTFLKLIPRVILCAYGAAFGDLFGSWAKRRRNLKRGNPFWGVDQLDFLMGCLLFAGFFVFIPFKHVFLHVLMMLFIITPTITILANNISYLSGKKSVPY